jgi:effector-binding domain-containing protein
MTLQESGITKKKIEEMLVASIRFRDDFEGKNIPLMFERLFEKCKEHICGSAITLFDYGVYSGRIEVEVCFPVTQPIDTGEVKSRTLEAVEVLSLMHNGPLEKKRESLSKLYGYFREHGIVGTSFRREITLKFNPNSPEENVTELQAVLHKWDKRFAKNLDRVLGSDARKEITQGSDKLFTIESTFDERAKWIKAAIERLNELVDEGQKYDILSCCAHDFSQKRIVKLRAIYEKNGYIDEVIKTMHEDPAWYEKPRREGKTIYVKKIPYDSENYKKNNRQRREKKALLPLRHDKKPSKRGNISNFLLLRSRMVPATMGRHPWKTSECRNSKIAP